jgi:hypothetical protein
LPLSAQYPNAQRDKPRVYEAFCKRIHHIINWDNPQEQDYFKTHGVSMPKHDPRQIEMTPITDPKELDDLPF